MDKKAWDAEWDRRVEERRKKYGRPLDGHELCELFREFERDRQQVA